MDARAQVKHYVDVAWRRKWWIVVPTVLGVTVAFLVAKATPKMYRASTTILVVRQSVPEEIVRSTVTMHVEERMKSLKVQVLSRQYLERVAREFGLIHPDDGEAAVERVCRKLASGRIDLEWDHQGLSWFRILVEDENPTTAAELANRLADLFIEQNTRMREEQAQGTLDTVEGWRKEYLKELTERDARIAQFRKENVYELPDQQAATIQLLNATEARITQLTSDIQMRSQRLETLRAEEAARRTAAATGAAPPVAEDPTAAALALLERELRDLLVLYTEENPLVKRKREQIAQFKAAHPEIASPGSGSGDAGITSPAIARLQAEIAALVSDRKVEQQSADEYKRRIQNMPKVQERLADLTRDYETYKKLYADAVNQADQAKRAQDIETAKKGEQFVIQDRANPPAVPFRPQVSILLIAGLVVGLGAGVGLALVLEFLDHTVKNEDEFAAAYPDLPILGAIPSLDRDSGRRKRRHRPGIHAAARLVAFAVTAAAAHSLLGGILG